MERNSGSARALVNSPSLPRSCRRRTRSSRSVCAAATAAKTLRLRVREEDPRGSGRRMRDVHRRQQTSPENPSVRLSSVRPVCSRRFRVSSLVERRLGRRVRARQCWTRPVWSLVLCGARGDRVTLPVLYSRGCGLCSSSATGSGTPPRRCHKVGTSQGSQRLLCCARYQHIWPSRSPQRTRDGVESLRCRGRSARFTRVRQLQEGIG